MTYATVEDLEPWIDFYGVTVPFEQREQLLELASGDVRRYLGKDWDPLLLEPEQVEGLVNATCVQAIFRAGQGSELQLGLDDGLASIGGVSFSVRQPPRFSPEAEALLGGLGLYARSGTALPDVTP